MDTKQRQLLDVALKELCSIQDEITHMNEKGLYGDDFEKLKEQRTKLRKGIIEQVDKWVMSRSAQ